MSEPLTWTDPHRMGGTPCMYGTRVPVESVAALLCDCTDEEINWYFPSVTVEQVARLRAER